MVKKKAKKIIKKVIKKKIETPISEDIIKTKNMDGIQVEDALVK